MANGNSAIAEKSFFNQSTNKYNGIGAWLLTVDHKRIGLMYFWTILFFFLVAAVIGLLMRLELIAPGKQLFEAQTYNQLLN